VVTKPRFRIVPDEREPHLSNMMVMRRNGWVTLYAKPLSDATIDARITALKRSDFEVSDERPAKV
jgi:hypothetical protein